MRRLLVPLLLLLCAGTEPEEPREIRMYAEAAPGTVFAVFADSSCTEQIRFGDAPVCIQAGEDGSITLPVMYEGMWLREETPMTGYYLSQGTEIREGALICPEPITVSAVSVFPGMEEQPEMTYVFSGDVFRMETDIREAGRQLQAGQTYTVSEKEIPEYFTSAAPQEIVIPLHCPQEDPVLTFAHEPLSEVVFAAPDDSEASIALYADEEGKNAVMTDGKAVVVNAGEKTMLPAGQYWYRIERCSAVYYENDMLWPLCIEPDKVRVYEEHLQLEKPSLTIRMIGNENYRLTVSCRDRILASWDNDGREHTVYPERETDLTVTAEAETDCYNLAPQTVHIGKSGAGRELVLEPQPFTVKVNLVSASDGTPLAGEITVTDSAGNSVGRQKCGTDGTVLHGLRQNALYFIRGAAAEADLSDPAEVRTDGRSEISVRISVRPFIRTEFRIGSGSSLYTLYTDRECLHPASDRHGTVLEDLHGGAYLLAAGTYYLKQSFCAEDEYPDRNVHTVFAEQSGASVSVPALRAEASLAACDAETGGILSGAELVLKENGKAVAGWSGEKTLQLKRNTEYALCMRERLSGYLSDTEATFRMPDEMPETGQAVRLLLESYCAVTLFAETPDGSSFLPFTAELYTDRQGSHPAADVYGNAVSAVMRPEQPHVLHMKEGVYYLFRKDGAGQYEWQEPVRIVSGGRSTSVSVPVAPVAVGISMIGENGSHIAGAVFSMLNENGEVLDTWTSNGQMHVVSGAASPGERVVIHQESVPPGYERMKTDLVYTLPQQKPEDMPVLEIQASQYAASSEKADAAAEDGTAAGQGILFACAGLLLLPAAVLIRIGCKKLHLL